MWCVVEREVNKHPHSTLTSPHAKISDIMTVIDREVVILAYKYCSSGLGLRLLWRPEGISSNKFVRPINLS
jgi:hypothetical protein